MDVPKGQALGCSKCRYSVRGCKRCRDPGFAERQARRSTDKKPVKRPKHAKSKQNSSQAACRAAMNLVPSPEPSSGTSKATLLAEAHLTLPKSRQRTSPFFDGAQPLRHPPEQQQQQQRRTSPFFAFKAADSAERAQAPDVLPEGSQQTARKHKFWDTEDSVPVQKAATCELSKDLALDRAGSSEASGALEQGDIARQHNDGSPLPAVSAFSAQRQQQAGSPASRATLGPHASGLQQQQAETGQASSAVPVSPVGTHAQEREVPLADFDAGHVADAGAAAGSDSDTDSRRRAFASMLQDTIAKRRQQRQGEVGSPVPQRPQFKARKPKARANIKGLQAVGDPRVATWEPPPSPFGLIEEVLFHDPWKLLVACILLNKTSGRAVRKILWELFRLVPDAQAGRHADVAKVQELIYSLGLANKRAIMLKRFSEEYLDKQWTDPLQLHGIGQYAADAYFMFCRGNWQEVHPADKDLLKYSNWLHETDGLGAGLERDKVPDFVC